MTLLPLRSLLLFLFLATTQAADFRFERGEIQGAAYTVAVPVAWNGRLLLYAHGFRPDGFPNPANLKVTGSAYQKLLQQGWMIGMTSYRKTGLIYEVGQQDLDLLWDTLAKRYGKPKLTLLHGESMGGTIVAGMAERAPARYQGALASSAALEMKVNGRTIKWRYQPRIPLLFLSTVSDFGSANGYVQKALPGAIGKCAVWKVNRPGHSNLNDEEVDNALSQLQKAVLSRDKLVNRDGTRVPRFVPSTAVYAEGGLKAEVTEVDEVYGNVTLGLTPRDLARLNLKPRSQFLLSKGKTEVTVLYGSNFSDVPKGGWVIFPKADGRMLLSKNFESAAQALVVSSGDSLQIRPIRRSPKPKT